MKKDMEAIKIINDNIGDFARMASAYGADPSSIRTAGDLADFTPNDPQRYIENLQLYLNHYGAHLNFNTGLLNDIGGFVNKNISSAQDDVDKVKSIVNSVSNSIHNTSGPMTTKNTPSKFDKPAVGSIPGTAAQAGVLVKPIILDEGTHKLFGMPKKTAIIVIVVVLAIIGFLAYKFIGKK